MDRESVSGNRIERLRSSIPLWLQLLMVCLLAWLLADPRWLREDSVQRTAIVLDSSASMNVFKENSIEKLKEQLEKFSSSASRNEYVALESDISDRRLYNGDDLSALVESLSTGWKPRKGAHETTPALRLARSLVGTDGMVIYVTDHPPTEELPFGALGFSTAEPISNSGFAGLSIEKKDGQLLWNALIRNYSDTAVTREWWIEAGGQRTSSRTVTLAPGETTALRGSFPEGAADRCTVRMTADNFVPDDSLPIVRPVPKPLSLWQETAVVSGKTFQRLFASLTNINRAENHASADLIASVYNPLSPELPTSSGFVFTRDIRKKTFFSKDAPAAEIHPLTEGLNWQGLITPKPLSIPPQDGDEVLLWQGETSLIFLRQTNGRKLLCFNFDLEKSNATKLPALVVLLHRFIDSVRTGKVAVASVNVETGQSLKFATNQTPGAPGITVSRPRTGTPTETFTYPLVQASTIDAPSTPGFFKVAQGEQPLLDAAAHFADTREADFRKAAPVDELGDIAPEIILQHSEADPKWRLWTLGFLAALLVSWWFTGRATTTPHAAP